MRPSFFHLRQLAPWIMVLVAGVIAVGGYLQSLNYPFVSDDSFYITANPGLARLHWTELWQLLVEPYNPYEFLPVRDFSYWLDITLFGLVPSAFRLHNMLLYLLCGIFVYGTTLSLWRIFRPDQLASAPWVAAIVTALFAIHPAHVEAVVWASGRKDVLSGMFAMLALWLALNAKQEQGFSHRYAMACLIALLAAMLSKATTVAVAPVIALLWFIFWRDLPQSSRRRTMLLWPLAVLMLATFVVPIFSANSTVKLIPYWGIETFTRALAVLGWMLHLAVTPGSHHYAYPVFEDPLLTLMVTIGVSVIFAAVTGMIILLRKRAIEGFAVVTFALLCLPYTQFSPYITHSLVTDRFLFLAVWPLLLLIVAVAWRLNSKARVVILLLIALPWGVQSVERPRDWRNYEALIETDLRAYPGYFFPVFQKVERLLSTGNYREAREVADAISDADVRNIVVRLVEAAYAVAVDAVQTGDSQNALARLRELGILLKQPLVQAQWNTPLFSFWLSGRNILLLEWETLAKNFPNDQAVREEYRIRQESGF